MSEHTITTEEAIEAFYKVAEYMRQRCNKFRFGSCLGCPFLNRTYKYCLMSAQFSNPHTITEDMVIETIERNLEEMRKPDFPYKEFL